MNLSKWLSVILMMGVILALNSLSPTRIHMDQIVHITAPMGMPMAGMAQGIMTLTAIMSITGAPVGDTIITM